MFPPIKAAAAGSENNGLPPTIIGYASPIAHVSNSSASELPMMPTLSTIHGSFDGLIPMALSRPCTAKGVQASQFW